MALQSLVLLVDMVWFMVFNATFNNQYFSCIVVISFIGGGNEVPRENHRPVASH
jgi:hypothetical protein